MNITTESLKGLVKLISRKEDLERELAKIDARIASIVGGSPLSVTAAAPKKATGKKAARKGPTAKRGSSGPKLIAALQAAGAEGVEVKKLSKELGIKNASVHVWFATTGKKYAEKVGRGHYRLKSQESEASAS